MSPELQEVFARRMQPTRMHVLLAVEWHNVEDTVEACVIDLDAGHIGTADIKPFMQDRFRYLEGLQKALVTANAAMRARTCYSDLQFQRDAA